MNFISKPGSLWSFLENCKSTVILETDHNFLTSGYRG